MTPTDESRWRFPPIPASTSNTFPFASLRTTPCHVSTKEWLSQIWLDPPKSMHLICLFRFLSAQFCHLACKRSAKCSDSTYWRPAWRLELAELPTWSSRSSLEPTLLGDVPTQRSISLIWARKIGSSQVPGLRCSTRAAQLNQFWTTSHIFASCLISTSLGEHLILFWAVKHALRLPREPCCKSRQHFAIQLFLPTASSTPTRPCEPLRLWLEFGRVSSKVGSGLSRKLLLSSDSKPKFAPLKVPHLAPFLPQVSVKWFEVLATFLLLSW